MSDRKNDLNNLYKPIANYFQESAKAFVSNHNVNLSLDKKHDEIKVVELFAGVGGFRIGFEVASKRFYTVWNNQWEPATKAQDASDNYKAKFGSDGHENSDIHLVNESIEDIIPPHDLLCGGFPCQDYSVATTLKNSRGIEGKKGVLWWEIYRILERKGDKAPSYLFLENVDRLVKSPASQRGRDFAIILSSLANLGYCVEWRIINAADYGMPQKRRRTYIVAYKLNTKLANNLEKTDANDWLLKESVIAQAFPCAASSKKKICSEFILDSDLVKVTQEFNKESKSGNSPFCNAGFMSKHQVFTMEVEPIYDSLNPHITLGDILLPESEVSSSFYIDDKDLPKWKYLKGGKSEKRISSEGYEYNYSEGSMVFPDNTDGPSRTIITGEGGPAPSRFKHVIRTESGKLRRLTPIELERLNMFPDNHTELSSDLRRAFLMGNALVTGIIHRIALSLLQYM